ncbi:hypothetical protein F2Q70_00040003 [Brassica cretica]|uniref:Uncharacterized protein n=1 Tax=Brassica cretica TaxID=69181 RepID=A0A8S9KDX1_BRACR|nr:hypothetical protein F2Q70_00040003 [Brassica cretica]
MNIEEKLANHDLAAEKYLADSNPFKSGPDEDSSFFFTEVLTLATATATEAGKGLIDKSTPSLAVEESAATDLAGKDLIDGTTPIPFTDKVLTSGPAAATEVLVGDGFASAHSGSMSAANSGGVLSAHSSGMSAAHSVGVSAAHFVGVLAAHFGGYGDRVG